jgi:hypothetical protein
MGLSGGGMLLERRKGELYPLRCAVFLDGIVLTSRLCRETEMLTSKQHLHTPKLPNPFRLVRSRRKCIKNGEKVSYIDKVIVFCKSSVFTY